MSSKSRFANILLSLCVSFTLSINSAQANSSFSYTPPDGAKPGRFDGELSVDSIGKILVPRGKVSFIQDEMVIKAVPQWLFDRTVVLKGPIIRAEALAKDKSFILGGLVYLIDGMWLGELGDSGSSEKIDTMDGETHTGHVVSRSGDSLVFVEKGGRKIDIAFGRIKTIESPRALTFNIQAASARINSQDNSLSFEATVLNLAPSKTHRLSLQRSVIPKSNFSGTEEGISGRALSVFLALDIMSTISAPIAIPLVLNARNQGAAKRKIAHDEYLYFVGGLQSGQ